MVILLSLCFISTITSAQEIPGGSSTGLDSVQIFADSTGFRIKPQFLLSQLLLTNYPNPVISTTTFKYNLPAEGNISLQLFNSTGQLISTLFQGFRKAGTGTIRYDLSNISSGVYVCKLSVVSNASQISINRKINIIR